VKSSAWLDGSFDEALQMVAERAVASRMVGGFVKRADIDWQGLMANPHVQHALEGGAMGGGAGLLHSLFTGGNPLKETAVGGLAGAGIGGLGSLALDQFGGPSHTPTPEQSEAVQKSQSARQELGILGANEGKVNDALAHLRRGGSEGKARHEISGAVPGSFTQMGNVPQAAGVAFQQGRFGDMVNQADILGLKNMNPFSKHFNPGTMLASGGANLAARGLGSAGNRLFLENKLRQVGHLPGVVQKYLDDRHLGRMATHAGYGHTSDSKTISKAEQELLGNFHGRPLEYGKNVLSKAPLLRTKVERDLENKSPAFEWGGMTGGWGPALASLAPLVAREWMGGGYRSGNQPISDLVQANRILNRG
jgi:hypothetical protein